ncbi:hypothetical protein SLEP1_g38350 [Rubroshorea leprosula]|nr:hypothetical protein SLEP1_g38350 [Rubroshorea leprosula]
MVHSRSTQHRSPPQGHGRGQLPNVNPAPLMTPNHKVHEQHVEEARENQQQHLVVAPNDAIATQLNIMQQQLSVFKLVLAQLLARDNLGDPLINLLNLTHQAVDLQPQQQNANSQVQNATPSHSESQNQSHKAPQPSNPPQLITLDVSKRLDNFEKMMAEHQGVLPPQPSGTSMPTPLNTNIIQEPYPPEFKMPQFETYDGTKDPDDHLHAFYTTMQTQNASDALMCKIFPSTLRGNARIWYYSLRPNSISSYAEMAVAFATKFSSRRLIKETTLELMQVVQWEGLSHEQFRDNLIKHPPATFDEVNKRSQKFITTEENALSRKPTPSRESRSPTWREEIQRRKKLKIVQNQDPIPISKANKPNSSTLQAPAKQFTWTSFTLPRSQILRQIKNKMELKRPARMRASASSRNQNRYCDFHEDHGHTTEQCSNLESELERLACKGMLDEYILKDVNFNNGCNSSPFVGRIQRHIIAFGSMATSLVFGTGFEEFERRQTIDEIDNDECVVIERVEEFEDETFCNEDITEGDIDVSHANEGKPHIMMEFSTDNSAFGFYNEYAKRMSFSIQKESAKRPKPDKLINRRYFVCYKAVYKRKPKSDTVKNRACQNQDDCQARMAIHLKNGGWIIKQFFDDHNHEMFSFPNKSRKLSSHNKQHLQPCATTLMDQYSNARCGPTKIA